MLSNPFRSANSLDENLCLATREDDLQWSSFVHWTVASTIYAEDNGISQRMSNAMPEINWFGRALSRSFRDAVHAVGSYAAIFERNVLPFYPRSGRNQLNLIGVPGPLHYVLPAFS